VIVAARQKGHAGQENFLPRGIPSRPGGDHGPVGNVSRLRLLALLCGGLVPVGLAAQAAAADPPGNNGTLDLT